MEWSDQAAAEAARNGNSLAFRALVERHSRGVFRLAFRMCGDEQDAEDMVQETFLRAYRQLRQFDGRSAFGTWLPGSAAVEEVAAGEQAGAGGRGAALAGYGGGSGAQSGAAGGEFADCGDAGSGAAGIERYGTDGVCSAALRRLRDCGDSAHAGCAAQCGEA